MVKTIKLASVLLKCSLGTRTAEHNKKVTMAALVNPVLLLCLLPLIYYLFRGGIMAQELFGTVDNDGLILGLILFFISSFIFCTGIATCINSFYLSSNINNLLVMPFSAGQITGAKFMVAACYEYAISLVILSPILCGYGYSMRAPLSYWAGAVLAILLLPVVPLAYAATFSMIVMRFVIRAKNKDAMAQLGAGSLFIILLLFQMIEAATKGLKLSDMEAAVAYLAKILKGLTFVFPDITFLISIMKQGDWLSLLWCLLSVSAILVIFRFAAGHLYLAGAVDMQAMSSSHKKLTITQIKKQNRHTNIMLSCTRKELRIILRTPAYYTSCMFLTLGWPILVLLPTLFSKTEQSRILGLQKLMLRSGSSVYFIFILFCMVSGITIFTASTNGIAPLCITREGKSFYIMKQLPIPYRTQLRGKQNAALIICWIGSGGYILLAELLLIILKGFPWWSVFPTLLFNILLLYIIVDLEMIYGLLKPKLSWESEGEAASKNWFGFVFFLLNIVWGCVFIYSVNEWVKSLTCGPWIFTGGLCGILSILAFFVNRIFYLYGEKRLSQL